MMSWFLPYIWVNNTLNLNLNMNDIEERVCALADQWQDYCLPDKTDLIKPQINSLI